MLEHKTGKIIKQGKNGTFHLPYFYSVNFSKYPKRDPESAKKIKKSLGIDGVDTSNVKDYPDMIEDLLGESENLAAVIIRKLISDKPISKTDRVELSTFIALMYARNPTFHDFMAKMEKQMTEQNLKEFFSSKEKIRNAYEQMQKEGYSKKIDIDGVFKFYKEKRYKIEIPKEMTISAMLMVVPMIDEILYNKTWFIIDAPIGTSFVTSDVPVFMSHPAVYEHGAFGVGFQTPGVKVVFPLSKESLLIMEDTPRGRVSMRRKSDKAGVRKLNEMIFSHSEEYVIARDPALILRLKKSFKPDL